MIGFRVLGPIEAARGAESLQLGGGKQRALLAILLLHANEVVSSDRLIDELWGEAPPETAAKALQVHVSQLRKLLEPERGAGDPGRVLITRPPGYVLAIGPEQLDLTRFDQLAREGRQALDASDPQRAATLLREALALWRGPALADIAFEPFAQAEAARLEELRVAALEDRIQADLECGRHAEVVGELESLVAAEPLRERPRAELMLALYRSGRQAEALEIYRDARRTLTEELGIEPGRELKELEVRILEQDPALELARLPQEPEEVDSGGAPFVGRDAELGELSVGLNAAIAGRGGLFLLVGEPGIGKSRLAGEVTRQARARGAQVLVGRCWEAGGAPAYWPWVQSLRAYVEQANSDTLRSQLAGGAADLAQLVPELRDLFPDLPEPTPETEGARFGLFDSTARFLRNVAGSRPLVIVLDDLHAADEPSLLLLLFFAGEISDSRILVVGTYRDVDPTVHDPLASTLAELAREQVTRRIQLGGLTDANVARYIELASDEEAPKELVAAIHAETEGNPLFVGEVVRLLAAEGRLAAVDAKALWTLGIPQGVREVIGRRLGRLSAECSQVLTLASVLGREVALDALERLSELSAAELLDVLDEAVEARILASVPGSPGRLGFGHALIRQTLYDQLTTPRRVQLHRRAAEALEALYAPDPDPHLSELAYHFFEAAPGGDVDKALDYARRAAERALEQLAYEEAARFYRQALQALELKPSIDPPTQCELLLGRGEALARAGSLAEAKEGFLAAAEAARSSGLSEHLARAALGYGGRYSFARAGSDRRLVPLLEEALRTLGEEESILRARLMARLAAALRDQATLEPRTTLSSQAVDIARRLGDKVALTDALISYFTATWTPDAARLLPIAEEIGRLAEEAGDTERTFQGLFLEYVAALTLGEPERVARLIERHRALSGALKQPALQWLNVVLRSVRALLRGDFDEGERLAEEALQVGEHAQSWDAGFSYRMTLFILRRERGRLEEIDGLIRGSIEEYAGYRSLRCLVPLIDCELGRNEDAARRFDELAADEFSALPADAEYLFCLSILSEVASELSDADRATVLYRLLEPYGRLNALASGEVSLGCVARYVGLAAATVERWSDAERSFDQALRVNARMEARPWVAHTQHDYARMLLARDEPADRARARELLSAPLDTYRELGMEPWVARATADLSRAA
jgi:DNA-binding SARP family transcriptional activator